MSSALACCEDKQHSDRSARRVCTLVPAFGAADLLTRCLQSLSKHAPANCSVYVLDDGTPGDSIRAACEKIESSSLEIRYVRSESNRGFVETCNWGFKAFCDAGADLLLLNSDTEVTAGFLQEMQAVLYAHEKHAVVTPRSNNATIFSVPFCGDKLDPETSYSAWLKLRHELPRYQVVPTAVGFCMLIKGEIVRTFGLFDEIYSPGYNEENDFVCRINGFGYSAIMANQAFVFHYESSTFGARRKDLDAAHRKILTARYPEYDRKVSEYVTFGVDPMDSFAELYVPHRPRLIFDLCHLPPKHCGTSEFALNLLREIRPIAEAGDYDLYVGLGPVQWFFHNELRGYRIYDYESPVPMRFDLAFKPAQVFSWYEFNWLNNLAPRIAFTLLDIISVRCEYLNSADRAILFRNTVELSDMVFTISRFSHVDYEAMYSTQAPMQVVHLASHFHRRYRRSAGNEYVLVVGNSYTHKGVAEAITALQEYFPLMVLGSFDGVPHRNVRSLESGQVNRRRIWELLAGAKAIVYPSHYEGFGLPVMDALALGTPVIARDSAVNREVAALVNGAVHFFSSSKELPHLVRSALEDLPSHSQSEAARLDSNGHVRQWSDAAREYDAAFQERLSLDIDLPKLRQRTATLRLLQSKGLPLKNLPTPPETLRL